MNIFRIALFILASMILTIIEMTVDPSFYVGRIFLGLSVASLVVFVLMFIRQNWRLEPEKIKKH
ncbi:hypothetical protein [Companilactobacillus ginsenosidimutans]|uniref:Uncharacterized protein n=1 Tax=Companilactobacillus ginsenosidimutans TaxID=1007676 RepID=A0A0H4QFY7_9LACO|nr:hypothetical protein [Companilactobacillus ginsenosidimutans]AKP67334.1 hypothetical protein ABM34_07130 [Companilactobacillus ginsenosidimutans]